MEHLMFYYSENSSRWMNYVKHCFEWCMFSRFAIQFLNCLIDAFACGSFVYLLILSEVKSMSFCYQWHLNDHCCNTTIHNLMIILINNRVTDLKVHYELSLWIYMKYSGAHDHLTFRSYEVVSDNSQLVAKRNWR